MHDGTERQNAPTSTIPEMLSMAEVQAIFGGRSSRTIRRWIKRGYLTPVRVGRSLFFRPDDIRRAVSDELRSAILADVHGKG
jgi:stage V sporulation protein SpoVS